MLLNVRNVTKRFGPTTVLSGVSFSLNAGEMVSLTGESGSGKSTLLHIAAGLVSADAGNVEVEGRDLAGMNDRERAALRCEKIGLVFQSFNLIPSLTVGQNLVFQARLAGVEVAEFGQLTQQLGLKDHLAKFPEQLSGGQQQRVAIGRAIATSPSIVLADEPTGNLDEAAGDAVFELLLEQSQRAGAGLLVVTHSERIAQRADRRLHLRNGHLD